MAAETEHLFFELSNLCDRFEDLKTSTDDRRADLRRDVTASVIATLQEITQRADTVDDGACTCVTGAADAVVASV